MSINSLGNGRWRVKAKTGFDPETGKPTYFDTTIKGTYEDAKRLEAENVLFDRHKFSALTLKDYFETKWLPFVKQEKASNTYDYYAGTAKRHVYPYIGDVEMRNVDVPLLRAYFLQLPDSARTPARKCLSAGLAFAVEDTIIAMNPVSLLNKSIKSSKSRGKRRRAYRTLSDSECVQLQKALQGTCIEAACLVMLNGGARREEAVALDWEMFDWARCAVPIERAYIVRSSNGTCEMKEPKNANSWRDLYFRGYAADRLFELSVGQTGAICKGRDGKRMRPDHLNVLFGALLELHGIGEGISIKHLRHTFATQHLLAGTDVGTLRDLMGHSSVSTILDMYVIPLEETRLDAQERLAAKLDPRGALTLCE